MNIINGNFQDGAVRWIKWKYHQNVSSSIKSSMSDFQDGSDGRFFILKIPIDEHSIQRMDVYGCLYPPFQHELIYILNNV